MSDFSTLSGINAVLQISNQYLTDIRDGNQNAGANAVTNTMGSVVRIGMAEKMYEHGNPWGYFANSFVPYSDVNANRFAIGAGMLGAYMPYSFGTFASPLGFYGGGFNMGLSYGAGPFMAPPPPPMGGFTRTTINIRC